MVASHAIIYVIQGQIRQELKYAEICFLLHCLIYNIYYINYHPMFFKKIACKDQNPFEKPQKQVLKKRKTSRVGLNVPRP